MNNEQLYERAVLVSLKISAWTARKYDKKVSQEVADAHGATVEAGRYNKHLMPADAESYKALVKHIGDMRAMHYEQTLPWSDDGKRLLPITNYDNYTKLVREGTHKFHRLLDAFVVDYPELCREAQRRFNGLFNADDYPEKVRERYSFDMVIDPVPAGADFRVKLSDKEIAILSASAEQRAKEQADAAQRDIVERLYKCLGKIQERLSTRDHCKNCDGKGIATDTRKKSKDKGKEVACWICEGAGSTAATFHDTLIENARDLCDVLTRLNIADDPKLEQFRAMTAKLTKKSAETLRDDPAAREDTAKKAQDILDAMTATYGAFAS